MELRHEFPWLVVELGAPHAVASWAVVGGGLQEAEAVAWLQVRDADLGPELDPAQWLEKRSSQAGLAHAVCMLTSSDLMHHQVARNEIDGLCAEVVATVGLSNRLAVGDPPTSGVVGTINISVVLNRALSPSAMLEAMSIAVEARTAAMVSLQTHSTVSEKLATGTGTDCIVVAAPLTNKTEPARYAGKHTALGAVIGQAVLHAVTAGGKVWMERNC